MEVVNANFKDSQWKKQIVEACSESSQLPLL
jgi:hypothetical protein